MEDGSSRIGWFLAGAAVGVSVGMLYAPKSGKETRKYIGETAQDGREVVETSGKDLFDRGKDLYDRGRKIADDAADLFERGKKLVQG